MRGNCFNFFLIQDFFSFVSFSGTFKLKKLELQKEGYDPNKIQDSLYFLDNKQGKYVPLDKDLFEKIKNCQVGL